MTRFISTLALASVLGITLGACGTTSKALGLKKSVPNEFNILTKAPLVVPPEYNLRPPRVGESSAEDNYTQVAARKALIGDVDPAEPSRGELVLMSKAGVAKSNQEIRLEIDGQNSVERKTDSLADLVLGVSSPLDPEVEAKRLKAIEAATGGGEVEITRRPGGPKLPGL